MMAVARREAAASVAVEACLVAAAAGGAMLLAWWALAFHPSNSHLWMVPVGLVLACTPTVVFLALTFSGAGAQAAAAPLSAVVVVEE
ncbi:hypothetical protein BRADI_3g13660v3 [Brachypodium distachyon]|uniref:Uncharacterized protein n=2 Tax=Brachypodium distachyon TaxID=15368 RepID=A0A0Q3PZL6_BRADI|nr:hypothetical protein BRADI_3g13660v3 [Brachypodium distachyon]